jgi:hypothetical protein
MKTFTDTAGRAWTIALSIDAVKRVKHLLHVDLLTPETGDPPVLTRLGTDIILLCDVIFVLVKPQADAAGVTDEEFGAALGGEAIMAAQTAFYEELILFFQGLGRSDLAKAVDTQRRIIDLAISGVEMRLGNIDAEDAVEKILGKSFTNLPESAVSTPGP